MRKNIHPKNQRPVIFKDISTSDLFIINSTVETTSEMEYDGKKYPLFIVDVSSASHPFYKGKSVLTKSRGRVERFEKLLKQKKD